MRPAAERASHLALRLGAALAGGMLLACAYPGYGLWWLAIPSTMLICAAIRGATMRTGAAAGAVAGAAFYLPHISWSQLFLGPLPWLALAGVMTAWWALFGSLFAGIYRNLGVKLARAESGLHASSTNQASAVRIAAAIAGAWTLREWLSSTVPYGGFAWGRLAQSQANSPMLEVVSWTGTSGLTFVLAFLAAYALEVLMRELQRARESHRVTQPQPSMSERLAPAAALASVLALLLVIPAWSRVTPADSHGTATVLAVQGDSPGASYFIPAEPGQIFYEHAQATLDGLGDEPIDLVLWPEGSVDVSPLLDDRIADALTTLEQRTGAPILFNTVTWQGQLTRDSETFNSQVLWRDGQMAGQYDKVRPIPFGEYVPNREFFELLVPDLIGLIQREYSPGERSNVLSVEGAQYGVFICFDIVDDALTRSAINEGAQVLLAPTNNADFGRTDEAAQQLAFARMRAAETGRAMVQVSTVGMSAAYDADGSELAALEWYTPGTMRVVVPLRSGTTPAVAFGAQIEAGCSLLALICGTRWRRSQSSLFA